MGESSEPASFEDINQEVRSEWVDDTTPYERVRTVISRTYSPTDAATIADRAVTSPKTARKHLDTLAAEGFVSTEPGESGATLYRRSSESLVVEQAADMLAEVSTDELAERITQMRRRLREYREEYGVESPEAAAVDGTNELLGESDDAAAVPDVETLRDWKTTRRNLAFASAALSIANAEEFVEPTPRHDDETVASP